MLVERQYNRQNALEYARTWAFSRNPLYVNYTGFGGDCTSFVSQSILAGSCQMNFTPVFGWFYLDGDTRTASWTGVEFFYNFMTSNTTAGPFGEEAPLDRLLPGDIIQLSNDPMYIIIESTQNFTTDNQFINQ